MRRRPIRLLGALSMGLIAASFIPVVASGQDAEEFVTGSGTSYAQVYRVGPTAGQLSLAPIIGLSLSDYVNTVGRGQATVADWAGIGIAERSLPDNTPFVKIASTEKDSEKGESVTVAGQSDGEAGGGLAELFARATDAPLGESRFRLASAQIPGLLEIRNAQSSTSAGVITTKKGKVREAIAITDIGTLGIAGVIKLEGLHWESHQRTGAEDSMKGSFSVKGASIGGVPLPLTAGSSDLAPVIGPINTVLAPSGLAISLPEVTERAGQSSVSPLSLDIENSPAGRQFIAPILGETQEERKPVTDAFIDIAKQLKEEGAPDASVGVLIADLTVGILSGSSQLHLEFGGVDAFTEGETFESPFGAIDFNPPEIGVGDPGRTIFNPGTAGRPAIPGIPVEEGTLVAAAPPGTRTIPGNKGGVAVAVGLIGIAVALGLAVADWYRMRASKIGA